MNLLQMSISASFIILAVIIFRSLAINHLPKKTFLLMWGVVLLRLLLPVSIPSSYSIYSLIDPNSAEQIMKTPLVNFLPFISLSQDNSNLILFSKAEFSLWGFVWGFGTLLCALYFVASYIRFHQKFASSVPVENKFTAKWLSDHTLKRPIEIREHSSISSPLTYKVFRPVILMPKQTDWSDLKKLQFILTHEYVHIRRYDGVTKFVLTVALCIHWFNPFIWVMYSLANRDIELSCDEAVVHLFGGKVKSDYALTLISMEEQKNGVLPFNSFSRSSIEERIKAIMMGKKTTRWHFFLSFVLVAGIVLPFATSVQAVSPAADDSMVNKNEVSSNPNDKADLIKFRNQSAVTTFSLDSSNTITIPISIPSISNNMAYCIGEIPDIRNVSMLLYDVHAFGGTGHLCVAMKKANDESDYWFNYYKKDKDFQNISWENSNIDSFGYDENYSGTYYVFIINTNKSPDSSLFNITGQITIKYKN